MQFGFSSLTGKYEKIVVLGRLTNYRIPGGALMLRMFFFLCSMAGVTLVAMGIGVAAEVGAVPNFMSADYGSTQQCASQ